MKLSKPLKNFFSIIFGRIGELLLTFIAVTFLIRYLGTSQYGIFTSIIATLSIFSKFIDLGFSQIIFREFSAESDKEKVISSAITVRLVLLIVLIVGYNIFSFFNKTNYQEVIISNILFLNIIISAKFRNIRDLLEIPFKSKLRMDVVMLATFIDASFLLILILFGSYLKLSLIGMAVLYTLANLPGFLILLYNLFKKKYFHFSFGFTKLKWLMKESLPLWGTGILTVIFMQFDVVLLKNFVSPTAAGLYSAALRIGVPLSIIPLSIITTVFPIIVDKRKTDIKKAQTVVDFSYKVITLLLVYSALIVTFKADDILYVLYGADFKSSGTSLILIFWAVSFFYLNVFSQNLNTIIEKQRKNFTYSVVLVIVLLLILFFTLTEYGPVGAGLARLVSSIFGFLYLSFALSKSELKFRLGNLKNIFFFFGMFGMAYLSEFLNFYIYLLFFTLFTLVFTYIYRFFDNNDLLLFNQLLKEPKWLQRFIK